MYLKSLVLKGFKSFADRSVLVLEPGITAVVGPNGSGKSNISDAVLWVLGERNAKNLRGQAMEDVIFSGSSSRKSVSFAEVELVLDNSDGTLLVDYSEVSLARRMYRSGESEYLINGVSARRLDVLDILHDSGLGTGTHSIISQGALDSVLQSKPEDRRALIEEAAGILKHKQRKEKSARKVELMDAHLERVRDVVGEVERQLGPLERKAKRARAYEALRGELAGLELSLAVDDLRALRQSWAVAGRREEELAAVVEQRRDAIRTADARVEQLQEQMRSDAQASGDIARDLRQALSLSQRIDASAVVVRERKRAALDAIEQLEVALESNKVKAAQARAEHGSAAESASRIALERQTAAARVAELLEAQQANAAERKRIERASDASRDERRALERKTVRDRADLERTQEELAQGLAHMRLVEGREQELSLALDRAGREAASCAGALSEERAALDELTRSEARVRSSVSEAVLARDAARARLDEAHERATVLGSQIKGLEELDRAASKASPSLAWLREGGASAGDLVPLSSGVAVPEELSALVEALLGPLVNLLVASGADAVREAVEKLDGQDLGGYAALAAAEGAACAPDDARSRAEAAQAAFAEGWGTPLAERIDVSDELRPTVLSLIGDVVLCDSLSDAARAHAGCSAPARFCIAEGVVFRPDGIVERFGIGTADGASDDGVLARARHLRQCRADHAEAQAEEQRCAKDLADAEAALRALQAESLALSQRLAQQKGQLAALEQQDRQAAEKLSSLKAELADVQAQRDRARTTVEGAQPAVSDLKRAIEEQTSRLNALSLELDRLESEAVPLRQEAARLRDAMSEAKLSQARLDERLAYLERIVVARQNDVERIAADDEEARASIARKRVLLRRADPLLGQLDAIAESARRCVSALESRSTDAQELSSGLYAALTEARAAAKGAHDAYDADSARLSDCRVEKGRIEVRLDAVMNAVVHDHGVPVDEALLLPPLIERDEVEEQAARIRRRIGSMGSINPDAAQEYEQLKARYDFLVSQMDDLARSRCSLAKIVRVIDERMREDFVRTFAEVGANFSEIFAQLFPGGKAELSLTDPDDVENSGVEVSAQPRGKRVMKMSLLSGGEKSLTALALLFAVYRTRSTPFYILDEVEAALDDSNLRRLIDYLEHLRRSTQLIMITHQRRTMEMADVLFGVSMHADGVTRVMSQKLERALRYAE